MREQRAQLPSFCRHLFNMKPEQCWRATERSTFFGDCLAVLLPPKLPQRREKAVAKAATALSDNRERVQIMEEHLKNVRQEVGHTNALMAAKKKEIATEEHLCALAAREAGRYDMERGEGAGADSCSLGSLH